MGEGGPAVWFAGQADESDADWWHLCRKLGTWDREME